MLLNTEPEVEQSMHHVILQEKLRIRGSNLPQVAIAVHLFGHDSHLAELSEAQVAANLQDVIQTLSVGHTQVKLEAGLPGLQSLSCLAVEPTKLPLDIQHGQGISSNTGISVDDLRCSASNITHMSTRTQSLVTRLFSLTCYIWVG